MNNKKEMSINVRCTPSMKNDIVQKAQQAQMNISEFILTACQKEVIYVLEGGDKIASELHKLRLQVKESGYEVALNKQLEAVMLKLDSILDKIESYQVEYKECLHSSDDEIEKNEDLWE